MRIAPDFNPVIFKKRREPAFIPRYFFGRFLQFSLWVKLGVWQRNVKRIFFWSKGAWSISAAGRGVINASKVLLPLLVPITLAVLYEVI
jgi:hypothetical protein